MRTRLAIVTTASCLCACGAREPPEPPAFTERDSAGIRIIENAHLPVAVWEIATVPSLDIGSATDTLETLVQVVGAHRMSDGRIAIANGGMDEIRFYAADGSLQRTVGRTGQGPGEYDFMSWMTSCGTDSLYVYDIGTDRLTVLDERGETVRISRLMLPENTSPYGRASCQRGGPFVAAGWPTGQPEPGLHRPTMPVGLVATDGEPLAMIGTFPGADRWGPITDGQLTTTWPLPFGRTLVTTIVANRVFIGTGDTCELAVYGRDGSHEALIRLTLPERPVTDAGAGIFYRAHGTAGPRRETPPPDASHVHGSRISEPFSRL